MSAVNRNAIPTPTGELVSHSIAEAIAERSPVHDGQKGSPPVVVLEESPVEVTRAASSPGWVIVEEEAGDTPSTDVATAQPSEGAVREAAPLEEAAPVEEAAPSGSQVHTFLQGCMDLLWSCQPVLLIHHEKKIMCLGVQGTPG